LTYKGKCEYDFKKSGFDSNIYNILASAYENLSISEITLNTYLSMEEIARYFIFCIDEGYFETPENSDVLNIAGYLAGKYKTGEYFTRSGVISKTQLENAVNNYKNNNKENKKFGQILIDEGLITQKQLNSVIDIKEECKKRFILDFDDIPKVKYNDLNSSEINNKQIEYLKNENKILKTKLEQLLTLVKRDD
jgi:hypothetical protein